MRRDQVNKRVKGCSDKIWKRREFTSEEGGGGGERVDYWNER